MIEDITSAAGKVLDGDLGKWLKNKFRLIYTQPERPTNQFYLDVIGTESMTATSAITDHYVEDNTWVNDNISLMPRRYTIQGEVGELYFYERNPQQTYVGYVNQKLMPIVEFYPLRTLFDQDIMNKISKAQMWVDTADNLWTRLMQLNNEANRQQKIYGYLEALRVARQPISIETPWTKLNSVVIENYTLTQPDRNTDRTQISITYKEFKTTKVGSYEVRSLGQGRNECGRSSVENQGKTSGQQQELKSTMRKIGELYYGPSDKPYLIGGGNETNNNN